MKTFMVGMKPPTIAIALNDNDLKRISEGIPVIVEKERLGSSFATVLCNSNDIYELKDQVETILNQDSND